MPPAARAASEIPAPTILGLLGRWGTGLALTRDPSATLLAIARESGSIVTLARGDPPVVMVLGTETLRQLLATPNLEHPAVFPEAPRRYVMNGEPQSDFRPGERLLDACYPGAIELTEKLLQRWPIGREIDIDYAMSALMFRVMWQALFGAGANDLRGTVEPAWHRWVHAHSLVAASGMPSWPLYGAARRLSDRSRQLAASIRRVLLDLSRRSTLPTHTQQLLDKGAVDDESDEQAIAQIVLLFGAGQITGTALTWTLFLLSQHPQTLVDLHDKLWQALHGAPAALAQLDQIPLLAAIGNEGLRMLPPCGIAHCKATTMIQLSEYSLPPGTTIVYSPLLAHRAPEFYLWSKSFRPERWRSIEPEPFQFLPFGVQPELLAHAPLIDSMLRLVLAMVVQHAFLGLAPGVRIDLRMRLTLEPRNGLPMIIAPTDRPVTLRTPEGNITSALHVT